MKVRDGRVERWFDNLAPLYRAWIATLSALVFGLLPILCAWITFTIHGEFRDQYWGTLIGGDALMIATSLTGPALILAFKRRDPETMIAPQLFALVGILLIFVCVVVFMDASPKSSILGSMLAQRRIVHATYWLLPLSVLYALWISYVDEKSMSMKDFQRALDPNGKALQVNFPSGGGQ